MEYDFIDPDLPNDEEPTSETKAEPEVLQKERMVEKYPEMRNRLFEADRR